MAAPPLTDAELERIRELHAQGHTLGAVATELGRSKATVGKHARRLGLTWDTSRTAPATQVKQASNRERRAELVRRLYGRAESILDRLEADQFKAVGYSKEGRAVVTHIDADAIPATDERALAGMAVNLLTGAARLEQVDAGHADTAEAKGILGNLQDALAGAYAQLSHTRAPADPEDATDTDAQQ